MEDVIEFFEVSDKIDRYNDLLALSLIESESYKRIEVIIKTLEWAPGKDVDEIKSEIVRYNKVLILSEGGTQEFHFAIKIIAVLEWVLEHH